MSNVIDFQTRKDKILDKQQEDEWTFLTDTNYSLGTFTYTLTLEDENQITIWSNENE